MDFLGNPLDSVRLKAYLRSFPPTQQDLNLITPFSYIALLRTSLGWDILFCTWKKKLEHEGQGGDPTPWHCAEHSQFCAACHFTLVGWLWLICLTHCNSNVYEVEKESGKNISVSLSKERL